METQLPSPKKIIFGPCLLWPNGWMDQNATWSGGRPRPKRHCVTWGPSSPQKRHSPQFWAHVYCGETVVCIRIPLSTEVGLILGERRCVRWGPSSPFPKGAQPPIFGQCQLRPAPPRKKWHSPTRASPVGLQVTRIVAVAGRLAAAAAA